MGAINEAVTCPASGLLPKGTNSEATKMWNIKWEKELNLSSSHLMQEEAAALSNEAHQSMVTFSNHRLHHLKLASLLITP